MEAFYQESGRAGRDQLPSRSVLYYGIDDRKKMEFILKNSSRKKTESSSSASELKKSLADFDQVSASFCHKSCDACKNPNPVTANLEEVKLFLATSMGSLQSLLKVGVSSSLLPSFFLVLVLQLLLICKSISWDLSYLCLQLLQLASLKL